MEIIQERIEREFGIELIATAPSVIYECILKMVMKSQSIIQHICLKEIKLIRFMNLCKSDNDGTKRLCGCSYGIVPT